MFRSSESRYGIVTRLLHWLVALLIIGLIGLGWWMVDLSYYDKWYNRSLDLHKALGMLVLLLAMIKIGWVAFDGKPGFPESMKRWERIAATAAHHTFYLLMILIPVTGYVISTSAGDGISVFGWFEIPAIMPAGDKLRDLAIELHYWLAYGAAVLVLMHAAAALKHQFIDRDGTLRRMTF
ncbi:MAG: cytochrome b [Gammaproteobacteria bacterium]|nr:cytochrome b [Gammaproteobacteria bacterium]